MTKTKTPRAPVHAFGDLCAALIGAGFVALAIASIHYRETIAPVLERVTNAWAMSGAPGEIGRG